jgi:hypothetical protein
MPSNIATASFNPTLTNYAQGIAPDLAGGIADFLAPRVLVPAGSGQYKEYNSKDAMQKYNTKRALGGPAKRIGFTNEDKSFNCLPNALEIAIDDVERAKAGEVNDAQSILEQSKVKTVVSNANIAREVEVVEVVAALSAVAGRGTWSSADADPIEELMETIEEIGANGQMPNRIAFGITAWRILRNHPNVIARMPGAEVAALNTEKLLEMLGYGDIDVRIASMAADTAKRGKTKDAGFITGSSVYIFRGDENPTQYDASAVKTFSTTSTGVGGVWEYRDNSCRSDVYALDWSQDIKVTATAMIKKLAID